MVKRDWERGSHSGCARDWAPRKWSLACKHVQSCYKTVILDATANEAQPDRSYP